MRGREMLNRRRNTLKTRKANKIQNEEETLGFHLPNQKKKRKRERGRNREESADINIHFSGLAFQYLRCCRSALGSRPPRVCETAIGVCGVFVLLCLLCQCRVHSQLCLRFFSSDVSTKWKLIFRVAALRLSLVISLRVQKKQILDPGNQSSPETIVQS